MVSHTRTYFLFCKVNVDAYMKNSLLNDTSLMIGYSVQQTPPILFRELEILQIFRYFIPETLHIKKVEF